MRMDAARTANVRGDPSRRQRRGLAAGGPVCRARPSGQNSLLSRERTCSRAFPNSIVCSRPGQKTRLTRKCLRSVTRKRPLLLWGNGRCKRFGCTISAFVPRSVSRVDRRSGIATVTLFAIRPALRGSRVAARLVGRIVIVIRLLIVISRAARTCRAGAGVARRS